MASKPKPQLTLSSSMLSGIDGDVSQAVQRIRDLSHSQRAVLAALIELDGASSTKAAAETYYSKSSAHNAFSTLEEEELATIEEGWPAIAKPTEIALEAADTLAEEFDFHLEEYLYEEEDEPEEESQEQEHPQESTSSKPYLTSASEAATESEPESGSSSSSSSSGAYQGFGERPAASWDEEVDDVSEEEIGQHIEDLTAEMITKAEQPRMSNLERERVRAEQAKAAALLIIASKRS